MTHHGGPINAILECPVVNNNIRHRFTARLVSTTIEDWPLLQKALINLKTSVEIVEYLSVVIWQSMRSRGSGRLARGSCYKSNRKGC